jgi:hypothetical protein
VQDLVDLLGLATLGRLLKDDCLLVPSPLLLLLRSPPQLLLQPKLGHLQLLREGLLKGDDLSLKLKLLKAELANAEVDCLDSQGDGETGGVLRRPQ